MSVGARPPEDARLGAGRAFVDLEVFLARERQDPGALAALAPGNAGVLLDEAVVEAIGALERLAEMVEVLTGLAAAPGALGLEREALVYEARAYLSERAHLREGAREER